MKTWKDENGDTWPCEKILVMVNHKLTTDQEDGLGGYNLVYLPEEIQGHLRNCGTDLEWLAWVAEWILNFCEEQDITEILCPAGSPAFMAIFAVKASKGRFTLIFSHSVREFKEETLSDGSVSKTNVFRHVEYLGVFPE